MTLVRMSPSLPPSQFLPTLPRGQPPTLSPLLSDRLEECIATLRVLLVPSLVGIDGSVIEQGKSEPHKTSDISEGESGSADEDEQDEVVMDEFERQWAENWLNQVIRRGEAWIAELQDQDDGEEDEGGEIFGNEFSERNMLPDAGGGQKPSPTSHATTSTSATIPNHLATPEGLSTINIPTSSSDTPTSIEIAKRHHVIQSAASLLSLLSGCSASGAIHRTLTFPLNPAFLYATPDPLAATDARNHPMIRPSQSDPNALELVIQINDAPLADHLSVGVQTWGSSVLLGREMAADPGRFGLDLRRRNEARDAEAGEAEEGRDDGPRILELGAGTGVLSIICRGLLDFSSRIDQAKQGKSLSQQRRGTVVATDYHPLVLSNLQACVDLNFPSPEPTDSTRTLPGQAITVMPLDWSTFPEEAERTIGDSDERELVDRLDLIGKIKEVGARKGLWSLPATPSPIASPGSGLAGGKKETRSSSSPVKTLPAPLDRPFDMLLACDCVYDLTHASLLRETASWLLRLPNPAIEGDQGGVLHLLSPVRRTYSEETTSIAKAFPMVESVPARRERSKGTNPAGPGPRSQTPSSRSGISTPRSTTSIAHSASAVDLVALRSGMATPMELSEDDREVFSRGMGLGRVGGWRLCTKERRELERLSGNGRSDELVYMWWTIMWC